MASLTSLSIRPGADRPRIDQSSIRARVPSRNVRPSGARIRNAISGMGRSCRIFIPPVPIHPPDPYRHPYRAYLRFCSAGSGQTTSRTAQSCGAFGFGGSEGCSSLNLYLHDVACALSYSNNYYAIFLAASTECRFDPYFCLFKQKVLPVARLRQVQPLRRRDCSARRAVARL